MSGKRYVAPESVLRAIGESARYLDSNNPCLTRLQVERVGAAVCRALSENPIVPTHAQSAEILAPRFGIPAADINANMVISGEVVAGEWQRRMFLGSVEPELHSFDTPFGRFVVDNRVPPGEIRLHDWSGPTLMKNIGSDDPPEDIKDLLCEPTSYKYKSPYCDAAPEINAALAEAFRRGQKSKKVV